MKRLTVLVALLIALPRPAPAQQGEPIRINYVDAELSDVIRTLAAVLHVNVVLTDVPSRRITFQTPDPVPAGAVAGVLEAVLESQGLVLVQTGPVAQVMPDAQRPATGPVGVGKDLPSPAPLGLITQIVPLAFIRAEEALSLLKAVAGPHARLEIVPRSNSVLITDRGSRVARYLELLRELDVKTGGEAGLHTYVYPLKHASATELAATLGQLFGATVGTPPVRARVQELEGRSLSSELRGLQRRELQSLEQRRRETGFPMTMTAAPTVTDSGRNTEGEGLVGRTTIIPDAATNALVIRTAPPNFSVLQETISQLDVRPPQVLLEVLIAEVTLDGANQYGINWQLYTRRGIPGDSTVGVTVGVGTPEFGDTAFSTLQGLGLRVIQLAGLDVRAVLRAVASRTDVRVLSTPRILALNNEEARIMVGSEVPFTQSTLSGFNAVLDRVIQYRNVGTQLTVIPTINSDGYVTLRLLQEASALSEQTIAAAQNAPIITTREAETSAIVKDAHTIVIGGLIGETEQVTDAGVPILKDIPLIGLLFKSRTAGRARTEIAIFLTPFVVMNDAQADSLLRQERERLEHMRRLPIDTIPALRQP